MKKWVMLFVLLIFLTACAKQTSQQTVQQPAVEPAKTVQINSSLKSAFKFTIAPTAKTTPNTVWGRIKNVGNATGDVKVTARIYYAKVIVDEKSQVITGLEPGKEANFSILMNEKAQFISFDAILERLS